FIFQLKAGDECLCAGTEYSWTLRSLRHPPALTKYETTAQGGFAKVESFLILLLRISEDCSLLID
ncbi:MAG: hypothetical protein L0G14_08170, partial [Lactococcus lactis]|nr:hypothetical protein [Lactococcus lactis]